MPETIPHRRRLRAAQPGDPPASSPGGPRLRPLARLDVERARQFLAELDGRAAGTDLPRAMYLVGQAQGHLESLLDVIDAAVTP
jgi:hypothetical protein